MDLDKLKAQLNGEEGHASKLYKDTEGHLTGGVGHNFDNPLDEETIDFLLGHDINGAMRELDLHLPWWREETDNRQLVLADMAFNLGINKLLEFKNMLIAIQSKDYEKAAEEMLDSEWAKEVHGRAEHLAEQMKEG